MAETRSRPLEITPLASLVAPINTPLSQTSKAPGADEAAARELQVALTSASIRSMLASPDRLREIAILSELIQPPRAMRPLRQPRIQNRPAH